MNATIEKVIKADNKSEEMKNEMTKELFQILQVITNSSDSVKLGVAIKTLHKETPFNHFEYGFGSNHMWVSELNLDKSIGERIIIVKF